MNKLVYVNGIPIPKRIYDTAKRRMERMSEYPISDYDWFHDHGPTLNRQLTRNVTGALIKKLVGRNKATAAVASQLRTLKSESEALEKHLRELHKLPIDKSQYRQHCDDCGFTPPSHASFTRFCLECGREHSKIQ